MSKDGVAVNDDKGIEGETDVMGSKTVSYNNVAPTTETTPAPPAEGGDDSSYII